MRRPTYIETIFVRQYGITDRRSCVLPLGDTLTKKISDPVADSRYVISATEGSFVLWDSTRLEPLSKHRSMDAAERTKAIHIRIDRLIKVGRQRREAR
ncbi:hypothetical protein [Bradyrhizobium liaoningense]|uniref:hypothetical protein n=1 Tax=Bradyrhizobium liaoningense TaxID=43992 RepID=UPI001BA78572|nr:hypothetical protein [Bradyrhizobium liaoningense]MBR0719680.1 hypothetical protein [Bradyrhizobium liaoningense]